MKSKFLLPIFLTVGLVSAPVMAAEPVVGAIIGGGAGAVVGKSLGGQEGAVIGGILGAFAGAALSSDNRYDARGYEPRRVVQHMPPPRAFPHQVRHQQSRPHFEPHPRFDNRFDKRPPARFNSKPPQGFGGYKHHGPHSRPHGPR